jgi:hypothetical protein
MITLGNAWNPAMASTTTRKTLQHLLAASLLMQQQAVVVSPGWCSCCSLAAAEQLLSSFLLNMCMVVDATPHLLHAYHERANKATVCEAVNSDRRQKQQYPRVQNSSLQHVPRRHLRCYKHTLDPRRYKRVQLWMLPALAPQQGWPKT